MPGLDSPALTFHEETKHSEFSVRTSAHYLDWENRPYPFKIYRNLPLIPLPRDFPRPRKAALETIRYSPPNATSESIDLGIIAEILFFSGGLTRRMKTSAGTYYMRAAPATGALYPIEIYVVSRGIPGLGPGLYHFNPLDFALVKLRDYDCSSELAAAGGRTELVQPLTLVLTSLAWRNAWKYEARSYRHWYWDSGVIGANLLATSSCEGLPIQIDMGFVDPEVDRLLGLEPRKEATVALAHIGTALHKNGDHKGREIPQLDLEVEPLSREQVEYPSIWKTNVDSELHSPGEVEVWRGSLKPRIQENRTPGPMFRLQPLKDEDSTPALEETILRRGSTRRFAPEPISFENLSTIIDASSSWVPLDFLSRSESLIDFYFIANQVQGLSSGSYFFDRGVGAIEQLRPGRFRDMSGYLCLDQPLFSDASAVFFLMTDLRHVLGSFGDRGYRAAQFEAGVRAGKIYLSSYALGIGASGSTFYDDAVTEFFSPHARDESTMMAVGIGVPAYRARPGRILVNPRTDHPA